MFVIPMSDHFGLYFSFYVFISFDVSWTVPKYCDFSYWNLHLKSMQYWAPFPRVPYVWRVAGVEGENRLSPGCIAVSPIPVKTNNVYNRICKYFCKTCCMTSWLLEKVVVAQLCGLICLDDRGPNRAVRLWQYFWGYARAKRQQSKQGHVFKFLFFTVLNFIVDCENKMTW